MSKMKSAILSVLGPKLLNKAQVVSNKSLGKSLHLITFKSESLSGVEWKPGTKVQIDIGEWAMRTYTPVSIDASKEEMSIIAFLPGVGPASQWVKSVRPEALTHFKGPDGNLNLPPTAEKIILFGDETSLGLGVGLKKFFGNRVPIDFLFEVSDSSDVQNVLGPFDIFNAELFKKENGLAVESALQDKITALAQKGGSSNIILSGRAQSIQSLRNSLLSAGVSASRILSKVYWSVGRSGLD